MAVVARDPRLRLLVGVLSVSTLIEGMVDVLVVVIALKLVGLGDAGVGWLNAAWGIGGIVGGGVALTLVGRKRLNAALPVGLLAVGLPLLALALLPTGVTAVAMLAVLGRRLLADRGRRAHAAAAAGARQVRARAFAVVESSYWLTTGLGAMLAPLVVHVAGPRGALAVVGAVLPLLAPYEALAGEGRHCRTSGSGVSSGSTCSRRRSKSGGSARCSPSVSSGSSVVKPGPSVASS